MANRETACKVLDYWFAMEFLDQDEYDICTEKRKREEGLAKYKGLKAEEKEKKKILDIFKVIDGTKDIYSIIKDQAVECSMSTWGDLTFYIGKIKRQVCIEKLAETLNLAIIQGEKDTEEIPVLCFQCTARGDFKENTFALSPILWALSQIRSNSNARISELLAEKKYSETCRAFEMTFFDSDSSTSVPEEEEGPEDDADSNESEETPVFDCVDPITVEKIKKIYEDVVDTYGKYVGADEIEDVEGVKFRLFKDAETKSTYDDEQYKGLRLDFYSNDLKMVKNSIEENRFDFESGMLGDLVSYICAPADRTENRKRHDFVEPENTDVYFDEVSDILNLRNAPLGKWPSRYMPAFMQQVAVNFATSEQSGGLFGETGQIFSVNGPPGTGKTTLLKEIIANNIVEKAIILSNYEKPEDAFEEVAFRYGPKEGYYKDYYPGWFKFKDERIGNFGVLVTSNNNAAVENISKEIPMREELLKNIEPKTDGDDPDIEEMQNQLGEVYRLFSGETDLSHSIYPEGSDRSDVPEEVFFTKLARNVLGFYDNPADAWGLVAAPLGKQSKVRKYYREVLNPLMWDCVNSNNAVEKRKDHYSSARNRFKEQVEKVKGIQEQLVEYADAARDAHVLEVQYEKTKAKNTEEIETLEERIKEIDEKLETKGIQAKEGEERVSRIQRQYEEIEENIGKLQSDKDDLLSKETEYREKSLDAEKSIGFISRLFKTTKYKKSIALAESYQKIAEENAQKSSAIAEQLVSEQEKKENTFFEREEADLQLSTLKKEIGEEETRKENHSNSIGRHQTEIEEADRKAKEAASKWEILKSEYERSGEMKSGCVLDKSFVENLLSEDEQISTKTHITNPWTTEEYNREREKLFFLALQVTKEFILFSKQCRRNIHILLQYWGFERDDDKKKIKFNDGDLKEMMGSLINTLFLITPVLSSTFASVGRLLKDVKEPGVIGTLVIDEAGQAQPQMAVGALFRSRRSIIVGDPKQVEPVVTDALDLLKKAYTESVYANYKDKSLSVQSCADWINPIGTFMYNGTDHPDWVGCPLLVHRRCISPMYEISNRISYNGIMKQQTPPPKANVTDSFIDKKSQWINVVGEETGNGDHFVEKQAEKVCELLEKAFKKSEKPSVFIISPFNTVVAGVQNYLIDNLPTKLGLEQERSELVKQWIKSNIGTVHRFQGKEANEVIFVLGCDDTVKEGFAVTSFVNSNIVNVAATRAKYRLYIIGDLKVWWNNYYIAKAKSIIDALLFQHISEINEREDSEEKTAELRNQIDQLPGAGAFVLQVGSDEEDEPEYEIDSDMFVSEIDGAGFLEKDLGEEKYQELGFASKEEFEQLPDDVQKNLRLGMKLYSLLEPVYSLAEELDASCCGILFCKGVELYLKNNFMSGLKSRFPDFQIKNAARETIALRDARANDFMLGAIQYILRRNVTEIEGIMAENGEMEYDASWWNSFNDKLKKFTRKRNSCCHPGLFDNHAMNDLLKLAFQEDDPNDRRDPAIGGVFHESKKGRKLES